MVDQDEQRLALRFESVTFSNCLGPIKYFQRVNSPDPNSSSASCLLLASLPTTNGTTLPGRSKTSVVAIAGIRGNRKLDPPSLSPAPCIGERSERFGITRSFATSLPASGTHNSIAPLGFPIKSMD